MKKKEQLESQGRPASKLFGDGEFHLPVYIQLEIGFTGQGSGEPSGWAVVSTQEPPKHRTGCSQRASSGSVEQC